MGGGNLIFYCLDFIFSLRSIAAYIISDFLKLGVIKRNYRSQEKISLSCMLNKTFPIV